MNPGPFKFSFGVSLLVHGLAIGGVAWFAHSYHRTATVAVTAPMTLELIAAPARAAMPVALPITPELTTPVAAIPPAPPPPLPEAVVLENLPDPTRVDEPILSMPTPPIVPVTEPEPTSQTVVAAIAPITAPPPVTVPTDNSAPIPGRDFTTAPGRPTALAKPDYLQNPEPEYPLQARRRGQAGSVLLQVTVSSAGRATEISIKQSSGYDALDQAAIRAVRSWEFQPARIGDVKVESEIEVPVRFRLTR